MARGWFFVAVLGVLCATAGPAWSSFPGANGTIVYGWMWATRDVGSPTAIRAVEPGGGPVRVLRDCPLRWDLGTVYPETDCQVHTPRYSPDGSVIAFSTVDLEIPPGQPWQFHPGVSLMAPDGTPLGDRATPDSSLRLAWSPTGNRLLFQRQAPLEGSSGASAIFLASLDGTELGQVTPEWTYSPDWSSTGRIAFVRSRPDCPPGCPNIFVTRLGGTPRQLTYRGGLSPSWSPHGTKLAFVRSVRRHPDDIYLVGRDGRGLRRLTRRGGYGPAWSPDGKWIAFIREGDLYVVRTSGRGLRRLVDELGPDETYALGPRVGSVDWQALPRG